MSHSPMSRPKIAAVHPSPVKGRPPLDETTAPSCRYPPIVVPLEAPNDLSEAALHHFTTHSARISGHQSMRTRCGILYLEKFRRAEASNPKKASFCWRFPHPRQDVEYISLCSIPFQPKNIVEVSSNIVNNNAKIRITCMGIYCCPQLIYMPVMFFQPTNIFSLVCQSPWTYINTRLFASVWLSCKEYENKVREFIPLPPVDWDWSPMLEMNTPCTNICLNGLYFNQKKTDLLVQTNQTCCRALCSSCSSWVSFSRLFSSCWT